MSIDTYKNKEKLLSAKGQSKPERFGQSDLDLLSGKTVVSQGFGSVDTDYVELHVYDLKGNLVKSNYKLPGWKLSNDHTADENPLLLIDSGQNLRDLDFTQGKYIALYNFFRPTISRTNSKRLFVRDISPSRTEIRVTVTISDDDELNNEIFDLVNFEQKSENYKTFIANFGDNITIPVTNWMLDNVTVQEYPFSLILKLYSPLPASVTKNSPLWVVDEISQPIAEKVILYGKEKKPDIIKLRGPNFDVETGNTTSTNTVLESWGDILSTSSSVNTSEDIIDSVLSGSFEDVELNIDYTNYPNFVHFSSAEERLKNFRYKLKLIEQYDGIASSFEGGATSSAVVQADVELNRQRKRQVKAGFDGYEKFLYFESGSEVSSSAGHYPNAYWPKRDNIKPYALFSVTSSEAINWYNGQITTASLYDKENKDWLIYSLPEHIREDELNLSFNLFVNMVGQHFDILWTYIKGLSDISSREEDPDKGIPKALINDVLESMGMEASNGWDMTDLWEYTLGQNVAGNYEQSWSATDPRPSLSRKDVARETWRRILNNLPYLLKTKGTSRSVKALLTCYGIPPTILRIKEYGGPEIDEDSSSQYIIDKFTRALNYDGSSYISASWQDDQLSGRKPDSLELRFKTIPGSQVSNPYDSQVLIEQTGSWAISLEHSGSNDGYVKFSLYKSGSSNLVSSSLAGPVPIFDNNFWSVMLRRDTTSDTIATDQQYDLFVKQYGFQKIVHQASSSLNIYGSTGGMFDRYYNKSYTDGGTLYVGGNPNSSSFASSSFVGSMQEFRLWTNPLSETSFNNHVRAPSAYNGNTATSSFTDLVLRYSMTDKTSTITGSIQDWKPNRSYYQDGIPVGFTEASFSVVSEEHMMDVPDLGPNRTISNKVRIESSSLVFGNLSATKRAELSAYDFAPNDSPKLGVYFSPTDVINEDIMLQIGAVKFDDWVGNPYDVYEDYYIDLNRMNTEYKKKYSSGYNVWDYMRLFTMFDKSLFRQIKKLLPARAKASVGVLVEPTLLQRSKHRLRPIEHENFYYESEIDVDVSPTPIGSYDYLETHLTNYSDTILTGRYDYHTGVLEMDIYTPTRYQIDNVKFSGSEDITFTNPYWQYEAVMPVILESRKSSHIMKWDEFYSSSYSASIGNYYSRSLSHADVQESIPTSFERLFFKGSIQTQDTTPDGEPAFEYFETNPNRMVVTTPGHEGNIDVV